MGEDQYPVNTGLKLLDSANASLQISHQVSAAFGLTEQQIDDVFVYGSKI
jgi:hypothetical protein